MTEKRTFIERIGNKFNYIEQCWKDDVQVGQICKSIDRSKMSKEFNMQLDNIQNNSRAEVVRKH